MKWPWQRPRVDDAELQKSKERLANVKSRWPEVRRAAAAMDRHREINGFAELIRQAMGVPR